MAEPSQRTFVRTAVLGCGYWGKNLVRNLSELGSLVAVADVDERVAAETGREFGVRTGSVEKIIADAGVDAVVVAAPAANHFALARQALEAGKDLFVEKPLALRASEARELCELAEGLDRILMVGHLMQYHPAFLKLKEVVGDGRLGALQYVYSNRLNLGKFRREEDILWSFAPHDISMILSLIGTEPDEVSAVGSYHLDPRIADVTTTHLAFPDGQRCHVYVSWLHPYKEQRLVVVGEEGMAVFDDGEPWESKLKIYPHRVKWENGTPAPVAGEAESIGVESTEPLRAECEHFLTCVAARVRPRTDGWEGLRVLNVLERAATSMLGRGEMTAQIFEGVDVHPSAVVDKNCLVGPGTTIWHFSHILEGSRIGTGCTIGQNVMIGPDVTIGRGCKIQNNVSIYKGVTLEDEVFCGPSCVFTNVSTPRAGVDRSDEFEPTLVRRGTTIGANATVLCGAELGEYSFIGAGAVVTADVPPFALMVGVPARRIGWVGHAGERLGDDLVCPRSGRRYRVTEAGNLEEIDD